MAHIPTRNEYDRAALNALRQLEKYGPLPAPVTEARDQAEATVNVVHNLAAEATPEKLADLFGRLATGGKQRPSDEEVSRAVLANMATMQPRVLEAVGHNAMTEILAAMREHAPQLVEMLRAPFDKAVADLDAAAAVLQGVDDLDDLAAVANIGGEAADAWKRAKAAEAAVLSVEATLQHLGTAGVYHRVGDGRERVLAVLDTTFEGYRHVKAQTRPWQLRQHGTLSLATAEQHAERIARVDAEWAEHPDNPATRIGPGAGQYPVGRESHPEMIGGAL